jgi:flagellar hook-associated protein 3 FlgL
MSAIDLMLPFAAGAYASRLNTNRLLDMRTQLTDLQRQLASGQRAQTYGGLGIQRVSSLTFRNQIGVAQGFSDVIAVTDTRLKVMTQSTDELKTLTQGTQSVMLRTRGTGGYPEITSAVQQIQAQFEQMVSSLNTQDGGLYVYSGRARDVKPVVDANTLMLGDGTNAGLRQVVDERRQADLGTGLGRMTTSLAGATTTLSEDAAGNPFGIKLVAGTVGGGMSNVTVTGPAGAPSAVSFAFTGQPLTGERVSVTVRLPDGKTTNLGFAVDTASTSDDTVFTLGATPALTAANLQSAIVSRLTSIGQGELRSASAQVAAQEFFSGSNTNPPPRVAGPPFATATAYAAPGTRPTVTWYQGDDDTTVNARDTQKAEVDSGTSISFGARANETAFKDSLIAMAVVLSDDYPSGVASTQSRFDASTARAIQLLNSTGGPNAILGINSDFGRGSAQVSEAKARHSDRKLVLTGLLSDIESASTEEVAASLSTLQTQLQASYQVTAKLAQLSLASYL